MLPVLRRVWAEAWPVSLARERRRPVSQERR
jgi:hypothetical protein